MSDEPSAVMARGPVARRELVRRRVLSEGFARLDDLARAFDVSLMTMHRDVDALEAEGWLTKIRGGATANPAALVDAGVRERSAAMRTEKAAITEAAAALLTRAGATRGTQMIFLDDSTTALGLVEHILARPPAAIATNFLPAAAAAGDGGGGVETHLLGGQYRPRQEACLGLQTVEAIGRFHADVAFMSTTALSGGRCLYRSEAEVMVREAFVRNASRTVLLVDHAKFGRVAPHLFCGVEAFDAVVTDDGIDPEDLADLRARCGQVLVAPVSR